MKTSERALSLRCQVDKWSMVFPQSAEQLSRVKLKLSRQAELAVTIVRAEDIDKHRNRDTTLNGRLLRGVPTHVALEHHGESVTPEGTRIPAYSTLEFYPIPDRFYDIDVHYYPPAGVPNG